MRRIGDYDEDYVTRQTPIGLVFKILAVVFGLAIILSLAGLAFGWFRAGTDIISPTNVKAQWQFAYDYNESLKAIGGNYCAVKRSEGEATSSDERVQRASQRLAIEQNYNRVKAEYDARLRDAFRARLVAPPDVPRTAPTLTETTAVLGCD